MVKNKAIGETPCVFKKRANGDLTFLGYGTLKSIVKNSMYDAKAQKTLDEKDNLEVYEKDLKDLDKEETKSLFNNDNYYGQGVNLNTHKMENKGTIKIADFDEARISSGTYNTKGYWARTYNSKRTLMNALKRLKFPYDEAWQGAEWNYDGKRYNLSIEFSDSEESYAKGGELKKDKGYSESTLKKICAFHVGRGGRNYNPGHTYFVGFKKIDDFTDELFKDFEHRESVIEDVRERFEEEGKDFEEGRFYDLLSDHENGDASIELNDEFGVNAEDLGDLYYFDEGGKNSGLKVDNDGTGVINIDYDYDTTYAQKLEECSEEELKLIINSREYIPGDVEAYIKEYLEIEESEDNESEDNYKKGGSLMKGKNTKRPRYAKGGNIAKINELKEEIESYELVISSPDVPKDEVAFAKEELKTAKAELAKLQAEGEAKPKRKAPVKKAPVKKAAAKPAEKARIEYNCEELIEKAKEAKKKRDEAKKAKENEPKKTEATKNKEKIEAAAEKVEDSIHNRLEKGEVSKAEIEKLIAETRKLLSALEKALKIAK